MMYFIYIVYWKEPQISSENKIIIVDAAFNKRRDNFDLSEVEDFYHR